MKFSQFNILKQGETFVLCWYLTHVTVSIICTDSKLIIYKLLKIMQSFGASVQSTCIISGFQILLKNKSDQVN